MLLVYCSDPLEPREVDTAFRVERDAAVARAADWVLVDFEALVHEGSPARAVRQVPRQQEPKLAVYRGWMLKPSQYEMLYQALLARGVELINNPAAYRHCHYLPEWYAIIEGQTPRSVWLEARGEPPLDRIMELLRPFGDVPIIVKDYVKSRKHEWREACFIPSAVDRQAVERVVRRFLELQGEDLNEGLVFREFVEFEPLGPHPQSGMPLTKEYRLFFLDGRILSSTEYWNAENYGGEHVPLEQFLPTAQRVRSRFFTMDIAKRRDGGWMIVELGDGQVSGLPSEAAAAGFYAALCGA